MACGNYICPGGFTVYRSIIEAPDISPLSGVAGLAKTSFTRIPEILSWSLEASVDEPDAFETADTNGLVTPCPGRTTWTVTIAVKYCETAAGWLYSHIMDPAEDEDGWFIGGPGQPAWWYLSFNDDSFAGANAAPSDHGILLYGTPTPPGMSGDNNTSEAAGGEFTISIARGPFFPVLV